VARSPLTHPATEHRTLLEGRAAAYVQALVTTGSQRQEQAQAHLGAAEFELLQTQGVLRIVYGVLGPVIVPTPLAYRHLGLKGRPVSAITATEQVALKEAVKIALDRGYTVLSITARHVLRLKDAQGGEHVMYVRVASGVPPATTIAALIRRHRPSLRAGKGQLILVTLYPERYARQATRQPLLAVWALTSTEPAPPVTRGTASEDAVHGLNSALPR
jgi:hypothetical protein